LLLSNLRISVLFYSGTTSPAARQLDEEELTNVLQNGKADLDGIAGSRLPATMNSALRHSDCSNPSATNSNWLGLLIIILTNRGTSAIRIILVEDFLPYRTLISSLFARTPDLRVVAEASNGTEAVEKTQQLTPDLVLMDIGLPELNGLEAAQQIRNLVPTAKIVFLTEQADADMVREALNLGAMGYILKRRAETDLLAALSAVLQGRHFVSSGLSQDGFASTGGLDASD
jgi:CheY-like chemotaxis protein